MSDNDEPAERTISSKKSLALELFRKQRADRYRMTEKMDK